MEDQSSKEQLEAHLTRDRKRLSEVEALEAALLENIPHQGFRAASTEGRYSDEKEALADSIRKNEVMLAAMKRQIG